MKKLLFILLLSPVMLFAQDDMDNENQEKKADFNRWSVEVNVGINKPDDSFSPGYFSSDEDQVFPLNSISHFDLGARYMFNETFGVKLDGAYDIFEPQGDESLDYESNVIRIGLQGVVNIRSLTNFDSFTKRFGLLAHGGVHVNFHNLESRNNVELDNTDQNGGFMVGLTPQFKLSDRFVLNADATFIKNYRSHRTWDGALNQGGNLASSFMNLSLGLTVYLGDNDMHADWYNSEDEEKKQMKEDLATLENKLNDLKNQVDGMEPYDSTVVPAAIQNYVTNYLDDSSVSNFNTVESLITDEYIRIYFDFDKDMPNVSSIDDISTLINFLQNNPDKNIELIGMTDVLGTDNYNDGLSQRRAKNVKDILVATGIDASRIDTKGKGKNPVYNSKNEYIRMLARTVTVRMK